MTTAGTQQLPEATLLAQEVQHIQQIQFTPFAEVTNPTVPTDAAAYYLNRKSQTLRAWACFENAPIRPIRINGRLAWKVSEIRALLNGGA